MAQPKKPAESKPQVTIAHIEHPHLPGRGICNAGADGAFLPNHRLAPFDANPPLDRCLTCEWFWRRPEAIPRPQAA